MIVYRVEHGETREGPYNGDGGVRKKGQGIGYAHTGKRRTPGPYKDFSREDFFERFSYRHIFGFESREALERWFKGWKRILCRCGYVVAAYEVDEEHVIRGKRQLAFVKGRARHIADASVIKGREAIAA